MVRAPRVERKIEYKAIGSEIKATSEGIVEGYLNRTGLIDFGDDKSLPGCFKRTLADSYARKSAQSLDYLWPFLYNHSYAEFPLGGIFYGEEDKKGLFIKVQMNMDIQSGREAFASFKNGSLSKFSMGYKTVSCDWEKFEGRSIRLLKEVQVLEGSAVTFPMNDESQATAVKNRRTFVMSGKEKQETTPVLTKDYAASYEQVTQQDWCSDLWNLWYPLKNEIITAFQIGDSPAKDVEAALKQFGVAVLAYVQQGIALDMTEYLQPDDNGNSPMMWMTAADNPDTKDAAGDTKKLSAASHAKMTKAISGMEGHIKEMKSELSRQRANALQGYQVYGGNEPPEHKDEDEPSEDEDEATRLSKVREAVYDLTTRLQFQNADKGI